MLNHFITLTRVPDRPGIAYQILGPIADANLDVAKEVAEEFEGLVVADVVVPRFVRIRLVSDGAREHVALIECVADAALEIRQIHADSV